MRVDCYTCCYAERDKHGRFISRCAGFGNCDYEEYEGTVEPTMIEKMETLIKNASKLTCKDPIEAYINGIKECIEIVQSE